jgi:cation transport ATPase
MTRVGELVVEGMDCPSCVQGIRARLERLPGVTEPEVLFTRGRVRFRYDPALTGPDDVAAALGEVGHRAQPAAAAPSEPVRREAAGLRSLWREPRTVRTAVAGVFLALAFILGLAQLPVPARVAYAAVLLVAGWDVARAAWSASGMRNLTGS